MPAALMTFANEMISGVQFVEIASRDVDPLAAELTGHDELIGLVGVQIVTVFVRADVEQNLTSALHEEGTLRVEAPGRNGAWVSESWDRAVLRAKDLPRSLGPGHPAYKAFTFLVPFLKPLDAA